MRVIARLEQALGKFGRRRGIVNHRAANAEFAAAFGNGERADGDVETGRSVRREMADGAAIDAARGFLQRLDDLHGADLGRAGDGAAGKQPLEDRGDVRAGLQLRRHGRDHGVQRRIGFDGEEIADRDAADLGNAAKIVAQQIDDHQILGAILDAVRQPVARGFVRLRIGAARRCALHRFGGEAALGRNVEEQLGREREDVALAIVDDGAMGGGGARAQIAIERHRIAGKGEAGAEAEIGLIDVAGFDPVMGAGEAAAIGLLVPFGLERAGIGASALMRRPKRPRRPRLPESRAPRTRRTRGAGRCGSAAAAGPASAPAPAPAHRRNSRPDGGPAPRAASRAASAAGTSAAVWAAIVREGRAKRLSRARSGLASSSSTVGRAGGHAALRGSSRPVGPGFCPAPAPAATGKPKYPVKRTNRGHLIRRGKSPHPSQRRCRIGAAGNKITGGR